MNWFSGSIEEAVSLCKDNSKILVVYVEDNTQNSVKLRSFVNNRKIREKLEMAHFVSIRIEGGSVPYTQFAQIYKLVPLPSMFFIGSDGVPYEVITDTVQTVESLAVSIDKVLVAAGKSATEPVSSQGNPSATAAAATGNASLSGPKEYDSAVNGSDSDTEQDDELANMNETVQKLEQAKKLLEQKRKEKEAEKTRLEKERELRRRREGQEMQTMKDWQHEQEVKELKENLRKEKLEEQAARQRILEKIKSDREERAHRFGPIRPTPIVEKETSAKETLQRKDVPPATVTRIQFKKPDGHLSVAEFHPLNQFEVVRSYVSSSLLKDTGIRDFSLATAFPRKEFTAEDDLRTLQELGLCPSGVLLIIARASSASGVARTGGVVNMVHSIFWGVMSPFLAVVGFIQGLFTRTAPGAGADPTTGAQKRANENSETNYDIAKKRNLIRFGGDFPASSAPSTSSGQTSAYQRTGGSNIYRLRDRTDSDDENNTWNGNSTQQQ